VLKGLKSAFSTLKATEQNLVCMVKNLKIFGKLENETFSIDNSFIFQRNPKQARNAKH